MKAAPQRTRSIFHASGRQSLSLAFHVSFYGNSAVSPTNLLGPVSWNLEPGTWNSLLLVSSGGVC